MEQHSQNIEQVPNPLYPSGFDPEEYKEDLGLESLSAQEIEMLLALWYIISNLVDLGWGVNNVQMILPELCASDRSDSVKPIQNEKHKGASNE